MMEFIAINNQQVGGVVKGVSYGREPYAWALIDVMTVCSVNDRYGTRLVEKSTVRVLVQGTENVNALKPRMRDGHFVYALGQSVPLRFIAADSPHRGNVILAADIKISQQPVDDWRRIYGA